MSLYTRETLFPRVSRNLPPLKFERLTCLPLTEQDYKLIAVVASRFLATTTKSYHIMSAQGVVDAVKDGVQQVADKLQSATVQDSTTAPTTTDEAKPNETKPQTLLDEVTGEYVSKSELKKRQKQRQKDIQKAERESTRQAPPAKKKNAAEDEAQLNPNVSGLHRQEYF